MPPSSAYNWRCTLTAIADILGHAARIRAAQAAPRVLSGVGTGPARKRPRVTVIVNESGEEILVEEWKSAGLERTGRRAFTSTGASGSNLASKTKSPSGVPKGRETDRHTTDAKPEGSLAREPVPSQVKNAINPITVETRLEQPAPLDQLQETGVSPPHTLSQFLAPEALLKGAAPPQDRPPLEKPISSPSTIPISKSNPDRLPEPPSRLLQSSKVPTSRIGRLFHYGGLVASLGYGAASEIIRRTTKPSATGDPPVMMTEANINRLVTKLSQMRGAALKLGQFMSIQDTHVLPADVDKILRRVQDAAHYMPDWQMERVMNSALGPNWSVDTFTSFERIPFAAASIGQVHSAILSASVSPTGKEEEVAVKIQYPNIAKSVLSDLGYVKMLLTAGMLLPKGLFLNRTIEVMADELADECNYLREASFLKKFGSPAYLGNDKRFKIPWVWEGSTTNVLVMERVKGISVGAADQMELVQRDRNEIASLVIELCMHELFTFRTMQTDPNFTNFLWNPATRQVELVDFGASREYGKEFIDDWLRLLTAAKDEDAEKCIKVSKKVGYLVGEEEEVMLNSHVKSLTLLATPFKPSTPQPFSFGAGSEWTRITQEIRDQIPVMLRHRLTPPPRETYSLNRKLSGAFLLASKLRAEVDTKVIWDKVTMGYQFGDGDSTGRIRG